MRRSWCAIERREKHHEEWTSLEIVYKISSTWYWTLNNWDKRFFLFRGILTKIQALWRGDVGPWGLASWTNLHRVVTHSKSMLGWPTQTTYPILSNVAYQTEISHHIITISHNLVQCPRHIDSRDDSSDSYHVWAPEQAAEWHSQCSRNRQMDLGHTGVHTNLFVPRFYSQQTHEVPLKISSISVNKYWFLPSSAEKPLDTLQ